MSNYRTAEAQFFSLGLKRRTINALFARGICTLSDLEAITEDELIQIKGIGWQAVSQLKKYRDQSEPGIESVDHFRTISAGFSDESIRAIDAWALRQDGVNSRAQAVRLLVEKALVSEAATKRVR